MAALREEITARLEAVKTSSHLNKTSFSVLFCLFERPRMAGAAAGDFDFKIYVQTLTGERNAGFLQQFCQMRGCQFRMVDMRG